MLNMFEQLMQLPLFQGASQEQLAHLVEKLPFHFLKYSPGDNIVAPGEPAQYLRFVVSGRVRVSMKHACHDVTLWHTLEAPAVIGAEFLFGRQTTYPFNAVALTTDCGLLQLRKSDYLSMLTHDKVFLINALNYLSHGAQKSLLGFASTDLRSPEATLAAFIIALTGQRSQDIAVSYRRGALAKMLGVRPAVLSTTLESLSQKGIIECEKYVINVVDRRALMNLAE